jgi:hypothetical protein
MGIGTRNHLEPENGVGGHARLGRPRVRVVAATMALCLAAAACGSSKTTNSQATSATSVAASVAATSGFLPADLTGAAPGSVKIGLSGVGCRLLQRGRQAFPHHHQL